MKPATDEERQEDLQPSEQPSLQPSLQQLIENSNQALADSSSSAAESAFGIGCSLGVLLGSLLLLIAFFLGIRHWTLLAIFTLVAALVSLGVSTGLAGRARNATLRTTYERQVRPQIERFLREYSLTPEEYATLVIPLVPENSPLQVYLPPVKPGEISAEEEQ
ncbi:MAG TPA: hypothetical protein VJ436_12250 [Anaerolineales bacterium]|nr:hypothetical protein [Anaerolineales bacterium]